MFCTSGDRYTVRKFKMFLLTHRGDVEEGDALARTYTKERIVVAVLHTTEHDYLPLNEVGLVIADTFGIPPGGN